MYSVNLISDYVVFKLSSDQDQQSVTNLKLQKLLYYIQAWNLAFRGEKLFDTDFQAWVHGPVCREIYNRYKETKGIYSFIGLTDIIYAEQFNTIKEEDLQHINTVLETYAPFSATELEIMTHREQPWISARKGFSTFQRCENIIDTDLMKSYYAQRLSK